MATTPGQTGCAELVSESIKKFKSLTHGNNNAFTSVCKAVLLTDWNCEIKDIHVHLNDYGALQIVLLT